MKQTAVEWLVEQLVELDKQLDGRRKNDDATVLKLNPTKLFEQAKEMEKEQMRLAHKNGYNNSQYRHDCNYGGVEYWDSVPRPFEGYYNETFNTNEK